jgi:hypothetical protein
MSASSLAEIALKVASGAAISEDDARQLMATSDLVTVGMLATEARRARLGDRVSYVRVAEISADAAAAAPAALGGASVGAPGAAQSAGTASGEAPAFGEAAPSGKASAPGGASAGAPGAAQSAATASDEAPASGQAAASANGAVSAWPAAAREIRITGTPASLALAVASARAVALSVGGADVPITAFSLADLWVLADRDIARLRETAQALRDAGVIAVAEVPVDQFSDAAAAPAAILVVLSAGLLAPVATWHEAPADAVASLQALHALQERTHAFRAFAPLPRHSSVSTPSTGYEDVKIVAVGRAVLNNIDHIQVDWTAHGPKLAQVALLFGASDLDRVSPIDDAPLGHRRAPLEDVHRNIKAAFLEPVERNGRFETVVR